MVYSRTRFQGAHAVPLLLLAGFLAAPALSAKAVVVYDIPGSGQNTTGFPANLNSYVGSYNGGSAVLVAPNVVLTTLHLGPAAGGTFVYQGQSYTVASTTTIGNTQMAVMKLSTSTSSSGIGLYTGNSEVNSQVTLVGFGGAKGSAYTGNSSSQTGWNWSSPSGTASWGQNTVDGIYTDGNGAAYLGVAFKPVAGSSIFTSGDSGGGMFINDNGTWKLAGLSWAVDGYYSVGSGDPTRPTDQVASIYNVAGSNLYTVDSNNQFVAASGFQHGYASEVSASASQIQAVINAAAVPEPASLAMVALGGVALLRRRSRRD